MKDLSYPVSNCPFFIFGCPRSGSSLLSRMLDQHPRLAVPYESHLFNTFYPWLKYYGDLSDSGNRERLVDDILATDVLKDWSPPVDREKILSSINTFDFGGIVDAILRTWASQQNKLRWGEKTPQHLYYGPEIREYFAEAQFIHIVRDGRDVAMSWIRARFGPKTIYSAARKWVVYLSEVESFKRSIPPKSFHEVHYEDLLEKPEVVLSGICDFLQESFVPEMLEFHKNRVTYKTDAVNKKNLRKSLMAENTEKWKLQMNATDLRVFEVVAQPMLIKHGYKPALEKPTLSQSEQFYHHFVQSPLRKLVAMAQNRKGHVDALIKMKLLLRLLLVDRFRYPSS